MAAADGRDLSLAVAAEIKRLRSEHGWSQEALADLSGVHRTFIGLVESGHRGISLARAADVAHALGLPLSRLVKQAEARVSPDAK